MVFPGLHLRMVKILENTHDDTTRADALLFRLYEKDGGVMGRTIVGMIMAICGMLMYDLWAEAIGILWMVMGGVMLAARK